MMKNSVTLLMLLITSLPAIALGKTPAITFSQAWIQEAPPNARVLAGFMQITNNSDRKVTITSADSDTFRKIEFHRTVQEKGMAGMQRQQQLIIPASGQLKLEPGSYHLMLIQPSKRLKTGDIVNIEFTIQNIDKLSVKLTVRPPDQNQESRHHH